MRRSLYLLLGVISVTGCAQSVNPDQGRASLMAVDREWSQTVKDVWTSS